nr:ATP-binding protein [Streptomyces sp. NBC_00857]
MPLHNPADPTRSAQRRLIKSALEAHGALPSATGRPAYTQTLPCAPESARRARLLVTIACDTWGLSDVAETGALVVSELVSNSVAHSGSRLVRVTVSLPEPGRVRIAVVDKSRICPVPRRATDDDENGRGFAVIEALADHWGTDLRRWGKSVWVELCAKREDER